jgi:hypothetical protein
MIQLESKEASDLPTDKEWEEWENKNSPETRFEVMMECWAQNLKPWWYIWNYEKGVTIKQLLAAIEHSGINKNETFIAKYPGSLTAVDCNGLSLEIDLLNGKVGGIANGWYADREGNIKEEPWYTQLGDKVVGS